MIKFFSRLEVYRKVFGWRGYALAIKTRLSRSPYEQEIPTGQGPIVLRLKTSDLDTYDKIFLHHDYEFPLSKHPNVIVDAGANLGFASIFFARKYPQARIFAIEPEPSNFKLLERNVRPFANITPIRGALWKADGAIPLVDPGIGHWGFRVQDRSEQNSNCLIADVPAVSVPTFMRAHKLPFIDLFKIDIESAEKELFENSSEWISKIGVIIIELHDRLKEGCTQVFDLATADFPVKSTRGENVFRARQEYISGK